LGEDLAAPGVEDGEHVGGTARERRGREGRQGRVLREGCPGRQSERPGRRGGDADAGKGAGAHAGEHALDGGELLPHENQRGVDGGEQGLGRVAGGDGDLGDDLARISLRPG
jgi:hypothetical protein